MRQYAEQKASKMHPKWVNVIPPLEEIDCVCERPIALIEGLCDAIIIATP